MINANQANTDVFKEQQGGLPEKLGSEPLRLIIVGHNPSEHAWSSGHYYSNPSNRMWSILIVTGIAPEGIRYEHCFKYVVPMCTLDMLT